MAEKQIIPTFFTDSDINAAQKRGMDLRDNPASSLPPLAGWGQTAKPETRDMILSALMGFGASQQAAMQGAQTGDPLAAAMAAIAGGAGSVAQNNPELIGAQRQQLAAKQQLQAFEQMPVGQFSKQLVEEYGLDPNTPLGLVQHMAPMLSKQKTLEQRLALFEAAEQGRNKRAEATAGRNEAKDERAVRSEVAKLRVELKNQSKDFITIRDNFARINEVAKKPSPASDLSMIFSYMKLLDPGSVVRESEFNNAEKAAPLLTRMGVDFDKIEGVWSGKKLTPDQRADFLARARELYESQKRQHDTTRLEYRRLAELAGGRAEDVDVIGGADLGGGGSAQQIGRFKVKVR